MKIDFDDSPPPPMLDADRMTAGVLHAAAAVVTLLPAAAYALGVWHAFAAHSLGEGVLSFLAVLPAFYYAIEFFSHAR